MHIAWMDRGGVLRGTQVKGWSWSELSVVVERLMVGQLAKMRRGPILVAWDDKGPEERMRVVPLDDRDMSESELDAIEQGALRIYNEANAALGGGRDE